MMKLNDISDITDSIANRLSYHLNITKPSQDIENHLSLRLRECLSCPHLSERSFEFKIIKKTINFCDKCKCIFPALIFSYKKKCPDGRWDSIPQKDTGSSSRET